MICCICLEEMNIYNIKTLNCKHQFHHQCIMNYINFNHNIHLFYKQFKCPICRSNLIMIQRSHVNK